MIGQLVTDSLNNIRLVYSNGGFYGYVFIGINNKTFQKFFPAKNEQKYYLRSLFIAEQSPFNLCSIVNKKKETRLEIFRTFNGIPNSIDKKILPESESTYFYAFSTKNAEIFFYGHMLFESFATDIYSFSETNGKIENINKINRKLTYNPYLKNGLTVDPNPYLFDGMKKRYILYHHCDAKMLNAKGCGFDIQAVNLDNRSDSFTIASFPKYSLRFISPIDTSGDEALLIFQNKMNRDLKLVKLRLP